LPDLPKIPSEANISDISNESEHYYITKDQGPTPSRMFTEKDIFHLVNLKLDQWQRRWMGTIEASKGTKKCVVLTTFTDKVLQRKDIHWDEFVKRTLDLPSARYLVNIEGIGIIKAKLHLIQEHYACETLNLWIGNVFRQEQLKDTVYLSEVMSLIAGILEGLNLIHSYGFLHPGLSSKKILLVDKGLCKIYDFCLSKDAPNMTSFKKSKMPPSLNHFPPETLHRNEYSRPSDVWSAAGVIWEILAGTLPFSYAQDGTTFENQIDAPPESQIILYEQLKNKLLYQCWHLVCPRRPTIRELRESYQVIFESLRDDTYEIPRIDLYTSMATGTQDGKEETEVYTDTYAAVS
ncbi:putative tyrosine-protein kinase, partial [Apostichopus japonicus]